MNIIHEEFLDDYPVQILFDPHELDKDKTPYSLSIIHHTTGEKDLFNAQISRDELEKLYTMLKYVLTISSNDEQLKEML